MAPEFEFAALGVLIGPLRVLRHAAEQLVIHLGVHPGPFVVAGIAEPVAQFLFDFVVPA
jgi:hypothetical protein